MSMKASWEIPGAKSQIRFRSDQPLDFVMRTALDPSALDPSTMYLLRRLNSRKKTREIVVMVGHASPGGATMNNDPAQGPYRYHLLDTELRPQDDDGAFASG